MMGCISSKAGLGFARVNIVMFVYTYCDVAFCSNFSIMFMHQSICRAITIQFPTEAAVFSFALTVQEWNTDTSVAGTGMLFSGS
jgi:hypothetical protein